MPSFLVDASLPRATSDLIRSSGYSATDVREIGLGTAPDRIIAEYALKAGLCPITRDQDFADIRVYPPTMYPGIVVIRAPEHAGRVMVLLMIESFLRQEAVVNRVADRLAVVDPTRIRLRPV